MFELFPDQPAYEYPELINVAYSLAWAFVLSSIIAITHKLTYSGEHYPKNFFQSLVLGSIVTAMVMMAIGDSLARGLGVFGAMAIIRFRTRINDPRNVLFIFAALSTGLAIGVYGYTISFAGTVIFCTAAFILHFSPFRGSAHNLLYFALADQNQLPAVQEALNRYCREQVLANISLEVENVIKYKFFLSMKKNMSKDQLIEELKHLEGISQLRITNNELNTL